MAALGLKANWKQFMLLVIVNAFVGGMVGLERTILPDIAETEFGIAARSAIFFLHYCFWDYQSLGQLFCRTFCPAIRS